MRLIPEFVATHRRAAGMAVFAGVLAVGVIASAGLAAGDDSATTTLPDSAIVAAPATTVEAKAAATANQTPALSAANTSTEPAAPTSVEAGVLAGFASLSDDDRVTKPALVETVANLNREPALEKVRSGGSERAWVLGTKNDLTFVAVSFGDKMICLATTDAASGRLGGLACSPADRAGDPTTPIMAGGVKETGAAEVAVLAPDGVARISLGNSDGSITDVPIENSLGYVRSDVAPTTFDVTTSDGRTVSLELAGP